MKIAPRHSVNKLQTPTLAAGVAPLQCGVEGLGTSGHGGGSKNAVNVYGLVD